MRKLKLMTLMIAGILSLSLAPFTSLAAEEVGESSTTEVPELTPAIAMASNGEIIYSPEEIPEPIEAPIIEEDVPITGGRSERLAYLGAMRYYFGEERPLSEYADWLINKGGWDPNGWIWELLTELYPDEDPYPALKIVDPDPEWLEENRCGLEQPEVVIEDPDPEWLAENRCGLEPFEAVEIPDTNRCGLEQLETIEYVVARGDNLWTIAEKLYGDGEYWFIIANANADRVRNPRVIYAGQILIIPDVAFSR